MLRGQSLLNTYIVYNSLKKYFRLLILLFWEGTKFEQDLLLIKRKYFRVALDACPTFIRVWYSKKFKVFICNFAFRENICIIYIYCKIQPQQQKKQIYERQTDRQRDRQTKAMNKEMKESAGNGVHKESEIDQQIKSKCWEFHIWYECMGVMCVVWCGTAEELSIEKKRNFRTWTGKLER